MTFGDSGPAARVSTARIVPIHVWLQVDPPQTKGRELLQGGSKKSGCLRPPQAAASRTTFLGVPQAIDPW
jgi:hypothetical protein